MTDSQLPGDGELQKMLNEAVDNMKSASEMSVADPAGMVTITYNDQAVVTVDRSFCPDPAIRQDLERALSAAVTILVTERESEGRAVGTSLGQSLSADISKQMEGPTAELEARVARLKEGTQARLERIQRIRERS